MNESTLQEEMGILKRKEKGILLFLVKIGHGERGLESPPFFGPASTDIDLH